MRLSHNNFQQHPFLLALIIVSVATAAAFLLDWWFLPQMGTLLLLQMAVVAVALKTKRSAAFFAGVLSALAFNFLFTSPRYTFHMTDMVDIVNMSVFFIVAMLSSHLSISYRAQHDRLKQAELRSKILLSVSHDLRTPLSSIIGSLETHQEYQNRLSQEDAHELIQSALTESHRLHHYVENLLQATRIENGALKLNQQVQSLVPVVKRVLARFENDRLKLTAEPVLPEVSISAYLIEQAIYNLVDNALRYSFPDTPILLRLFHENSQLVLTVTNQGPVLNRTECNNITNAFYSTRQGDAGEGGSGLGLAVTSGIIQAHQGQLTPQPQRNGMTFILTLPTVTPDTHD